MTEKLIEGDVGEQQQGRWPSLHVDDPHHWTQSRRKVGFSIARGRRQLFDRPGSPPSAGSHATAAAANLDGDGGRASSLGAKRDGRFAIVRGR